MCEKSWGLAERHSLSLQPAQSLVHPVGRGLVGGGAVVWEEYTEAC